VAGRERSRDYSGDSSDTNKIDFTKKGQLALLDWNLDGSWQVRELKTVVTNKQLSMICACAALASCNGPNTNGANQTATVQSTSTATASRKNLVGYTFFSGNLVMPPTAIANVFSPYDTSVDSVPAGVGKHVGRGETLVKLEIPGASAATAEVKQQLRDERAQAISDRGDNSGPVQQAREVLKQAQQAQKQAQDTVNSGGQADVDGAAQGVQQAQADLDQAKQKLGQTLAPDQQQVQLTADQLAEVRAEARKGFVRSPLSGTVVSVIAKPGMDAHADQTLATVIDYDRVKVDAQIPAAQRDSVSRGTRVNVMLAGTAEPIVGRVERVTVIPPEGGKPSPGYQAEISFLDPEKIAPPIAGVKGVGVKGQEVQHALVIPAAAVFRQNGASVVYVQQGTKWVATPVQTGVTDGALVEIKSGISDGAVVKVAGQSSS